MSKMNFDSRIEWLRSRNGSVEFFPVEAHGVKLVRVEVKIRRRGAEETFAYDFAQEYFYDGMSMNISYAIQSAYWQLEGSQKTAPGDGEKIAAEVESA